ncbi:hypothetical protein OsccyDRAFT_2007 [Leptolyngbyaceae cyanobacterium JSC-12]|nr:hypothetical protein OsccyDRAFT_2007 [Leptolyngbyaceae cyanobacterium JSC-12]
MVMNQNIVKRREVGVGIMEVRERFEPSQLHLDETRPISDIRYPFVPIYLA